MNILHEDTCLLIVNKPAGISVLPEGWEAGAPHLLQQLEGEFGRLWVVHRLDKTTSGVLAFARTADAHRNLNQQFERREAEKTYHTLVTGHPRWEEHTAKHLLRVNVGHKHRTMVDHKNGKPSETAFKVLKRYQDASLIEARPKTGRTHQIRVHLYALGHPILADVLYSGPETGLIARPALHALALRLQHPETGEWLELHAPYPPDFRYVLERLEKGQHL